MRQIRTLILFELVLILTISCKKESDIELDSHSSKVVIEGNLINVTSLDSLPTIGIYVKDYITKDLTSTEKKIDSSLKFRFEFEISEQQDIILLYKTLIYLIVKPGDSLYLILDAKAKTKKDVLSNLKVSGSSKEINNNLNNYFANDPIDYDDYREKNQELTSNEFKLYRDSVYNEQSKFIDTLILNNNFSRPLINWLEAQKLFGLPTSYSFFEYYKTEKNNYYDVGDSENSKTINIDKYDINNLPIMESRYFINSNASNNLPKNILGYYTISSQDELKKLDPNEGYTFLLNKIINETTNDSLLLQSIFNELNQANFNQLSIETYVNNKELIDNILNNSKFKNSIQKKYEDVLNQINNQKFSEKTKLLEFKSDDISKLLNEIVTNAKGKPIFIDNWATWCQPCLSEFKEGTPKLKEQFKDSIEYVYLCYKSDKEQWKTIISKYNLEGKHYFIEDDQYEDLIELFSINGFPTYTLINKNGEIVKSGNNYRPSNIETSEILNQLIKE